MTKTGKTELSRAWSRLRTRKETGSRLEKAVSKDEQLATPESQAGASDCLKTGREAADTEDNFLLL